MAEKLYKKTPSGYEEIYPLTYIQSIMDSESGKALTSILGSFNNVYVPYQDSVENTRNMVPESMRRKGLWITYDNGTKYITEYYKGTVDDIEEHWSNSVNWQVVPDLELVQTEASKLPDGIITPDKLSPALQELIKQNNTITNLPDDEDLEERNGVMSLKERKYNPYIASGKGYKILRKNWVKGRNILTQDMISDSNTIYEIRYDYDLDDKEITIPEGCILKFIGGSLKNGIINFNKSAINAGLYKIFNNIQFKGNIINHFYVEWFGANDNRLDNDIPINEAISCINNLTNGGILILKGRYIISDTIYIKQGVSIDGISAIDSFNKAVPQDENFGSAILCNFNDSKKWVIDSYVTENSEQVKYEYNRLHISTKEWGKNRNGGGYIKNIAIQKYSKCNLDYIFGGIRISQIYFSELSNIYIYDVAVGLCLNNSWGTLLYKSHIVGFYCGVYAGYLVTDFRIAYSTIDRTYYSKETFYIPDEIIETILFNDRVKLLPTYTDVKSSALLVESSGTDSSKVGIYNSIIQGFDAVACMSSGYIILQDLYLEDIKKTIAWTYNGNINFKTTIYPVAKTESFTFGTITGKITAKQVQFCTCYIDESNTTSQDILYRIIPLDRSVIWYDSYIINEEGKVEEMKHCDKKEIISDNCDIIYCGAEIGDEIYDDTYRYILHTGLNSNSPTYFSEIIKRGFNNKTIIITHGNTDISARGILLDGKNFYFKKSKRNGSAAVLPQSSPIKIKDCNITIEHDLKTNGRFLEKTDNETITTDEIQYSFEVSGKCIIKTIGYVGYDEGNAGYKLLKLVGDKPIEIDVYVNGNYVNTDNIIKNPDFSNKYVVNVIKPNGTIKTYTNIKNEGTFAEKPLASTGIPSGFAYFCTDKQTTEGSRNGIMIYHDGGDIWVDALGRIVS